MFVELKFKFTSPHGGSWISSSCNCADSDNQAIEWVIKEIDRIKKRYNDLKMSEIVLGQVLYNQLTRREIKKFT